MVAFEKGPELLKSVRSEFDEVEGRPVRVPMKMAVLEEVFPVGNALVNRQGKADAFESCAVRMNPLLPSLLPLVIGSPSIGHSRPPIPAPVHAEITQ